MFARGVGGGKAARGMPPPLRRRPAVRPAHERRRLYRCRLCARLRRLDGGDLRGARLGPYGELPGVGMIGLSVGRRGSAAANAATLR
jgi:hypothetical protein